MQSITVVIPALDEAAQLPAALASTARADNVETLVVDGGSRDGTAAVASAWGVRVIASAAPRGRQMNAGARASSGDILVFLHADAVLPAGFDAEVRSTLKAPGVAAGAFSLAIDGHGPGLRRVERVANWRARRLEMPYGDQALFVFRDMFEALGRFPELPIMEDFEFVRRARRRGNVIISPEVVLTSARRWQALGVWRTTLINQGVILGYMAGIAPGRIARWYDRAGALAAPRGAAAEQSPR